MHISILYQLDWQMSSEHRCS